MGLDVSAYSKLEKINCHFNSDGEPIDPKTGDELDYDEYVQVFVNPDFPGRADALEQRGVYTFSDSDGMYVGAYGRYNRWRDELAKLAGWPLREHVGYGGIKEQSYCVSCWYGETGPFSEIINFTDCDGVLDHTTCKKLAGDFQAFQGKADAHSDDDFREKYSEWREMFVLASDNGCVVFH